MISPMRWPGLVVMLMLAATPTPAAADETASVDCPPAFFADAGEVDCMTIVVPERHADPDGTSISLFVAVLRARSDNPAADPVVYLAGGPGATAAEAAQYLAASAMRERRDIILFEQRGTLLTDPYLGCPALDQQEVLFGADPGMPERFADVIGASAGACATAHEAAGTDLDAYTTTASVEDLELVRQALGVERWNLYGGSYGTRLALEVLRRHPETVRAAVLDSVDAPGGPRYVERTPNLALAFAAAAEACATDAACATRYGDLELLLDRALDRWRDSPTTVYAFYTDDAQTSFLVDEGAVASLVYSQLATDPASLPLALERLAVGDTTLLELQDLRPDLVSEGMRLSIECPEIRATSSDDQRRRDETDPDLALAFRRFPEPVACSVWPVVPLAEPITPVRSNVPVLLISGAFDPITPPAFAELAARTLTDARHHIVARGGHGAGFFDPCAIEVRDAFLENPDAAGPTCESHQSFLTDVTPHGPMAEAWRSILAARLPRVSPLPIIGVTGAGLLATLLGAAVALLRGRRSRAIVALALASAVMLATGAVVGWMWLAHPPIVGVVGLPSAFVWVPWALAAAVALGVVSIGMVAVAAVRARGRGRVLLVAGAIPVTAGVWLLVANGLAVPFA